MWSIVIADWQVTFQGKFHFTLSWRMTVILVAVLITVATWAQVTGPDITGLGYQFW